MAALQGLLYIMHFVCGQKPDILIHKITCIKIQLGIQKQKQV